MPESVPPSSDDLAREALEESSFGHESWTQIPGRLAELTSKRAEAEEHCRNVYEARKRRAEAGRREALATAEERRSTDSSELAALLESMRSKAKTEFETEIHETETELSNIRRTAEARYRKTHEKAVNEHSSTKWEAATMYEAAEEGANETRKLATVLLESESESLQILSDETDALTERYRGFLGKGYDPSPPAFDVEVPEGDPLPTLRGKIEDADALVLKLESLKLPRAFQGPKIAWLFLLPALALAYPSWRYLGTTVGPVVAVVASIAIGIGLRKVVNSAARKSLLAAITPLKLDLVNARRLIEISERWVKESHLERITAATQRRDSDLARSEVRRTKTLEEAGTARDQKVQEAQATAVARRAEATARRDKALVQAAETQTRRAQEIAEQYEAEKVEIAAKYQAAIDDAEAKHTADWNSLADAWSTGMAELTATVNAIRAETDVRFPDWDHYVGKFTPNDLPKAIRFGEFDVDLAKSPGGLSADERLRAMAPTAYKVPAIAAFPEHSSIALDFSGEAGRKATIEGMQAVMLRYLTGLPPGKVRLTILDPVGLGRNFAGFMHLADYAEALVNSRIWTEPQHIDARLSEINVHIETVIQNYLRNEFPTLESYNEQAAEVAEPYKILVVPDFPSGFNESTARRLLAIAKSGPRCGVYIVLGVDSSQQFPPSVTREELLKNFVRVSWKDGKFLLRNPAYQPFPFTLDAPPDAESMTRLLHKIGAAARDANKVEVPFEVIAPKVEDYWKGDTRSEVVVPLGRSGATKLQPLRLGRGTSQHVLIAGRTGSGKSTLLHALITNSALIYSPDEIELYLIDFKKGVEFKTYATHGLPHARVVAIESEREFGLSVLQRLDVELKRRGDLYRDLGVQDVAGFRAAKPDMPMPRILLIVDEFQEFFIEDDKLAQECSLLLDRLVRQGRAFGVHVHLGSQTLGGAYSLARSTLGQMAIRIALQCAEADAHLILNEENSAARLLSRPGEAIYNDANGQTEGNHVFQVVWLPDARRETYLKSIAQLARERGVKTKPAIVFEGNKPSELANLAILNQPRSPKTSGTVYAWLGEAVAIKDPTAAAFRAQGGNNLLILGQNDEMATGITTAILFGLSAQLPDASRFLILDGTPDENVSFGHLTKVASKLPVVSMIGGPRDTTAMMTEASAELERRQNGSGETAPWFLIIHDLPRFRDLRKSDDDFSFSSRRGGEEKAVSPSKAFGNVLREGPALGIHVIIWCDSLNNANRAFDRATMREFEMRVLFQMSAGDSSNLIDSPLASRLGANRAFFSSEEEGKLEKFRPYGIPSAEWLESR